MAVVAVVAVASNAVEDAVRNHFDPHRTAMRDSEEIIAGRVYWAATEIEWLPYGEMWELRTTLVPTRRRTDMPRLDGFQSLTPLCGALLVAMPQAPQDVMGRQNVFRVSVNFWDVEDGEITGDKVLPTPVPLAIDGGSCPTDISRWANPLTFPEPLEDWELVSFNLHLEEPLNADNTASFAWRADGQPRVGEFPFGAACEAVLREAPVFRRVGGIDDGETLLVLAGRGIRFLMFNYTEGFYTRFRIIDGACVELERGEVL